MQKKMRPNANEEGTSNVESQSGPNNEGGQHNAGSQSATNNENNEASKTDSLFGDVTDDMISSIPDFQSQASTSNNYKGKGKGKMIDKKPKPVVRRRVSERIKENWFKKPKPFVGPGSNPEQPICMDIDEEPSSKITPKRALKIAAKG